MADFFIVLAVGILGLLAQAAAGKRLQRIIFVPADSTVPSSSTAQPSTQQAFERSGNGELTQNRTNYPTQSEAQHSVVSESVANDAPPAHSVKSEPAEVSAAHITESTKFSEQESAPVVDSSTAAGSGSAVESTESSVASPVDGSTETSVKGAVDGSTECSEKVLPVDGPAETRETASAQVAEVITNKEKESGIVAESSTTSEEQSETVADSSTISEKESGPSASSTILEKHSESESSTISNKASAIVAEPGASPIIDGKAGAETRDSVVAEQKLVEPTPTQSAHVSTSIPPSGAAKPGAPSVNSLPDFETYAARKPGLEYFLRVIIFLWFLGLAMFFFISTSAIGATELVPTDPWVAQVTFITCALTGFTLIKGFRTFVSYICSGVECLFDLKFLKSSLKDWSTVKPAFEAIRVYIPTSIPHMVALFIYVQTMFYLLSAMSPKTDFQMPGMPIALPLPLDQLFSYNGLGLVILTFFGCGIFVTRNFGEVMKRLALVKPTPQQIAIGFGLILMSFLYDYLWSLYTHGQNIGLDIKLSGYNGGTFAAQGGFTGALILALATAAFAGVGEETLVRGGLQPVFGLVPAAILHGVLHAQFQHAPIFIVQVAGWSILMGIAKKYTNTTTTIIGHAGFNFVTSFLFAFNP